MEPLHIDSLPLGTWRDPHGATFYRRPTGYVVHLGGERFGTGPRPLWEAVKVPEPAAPERVPAHRVALGLALSVTAWLATQWGRLLWTLRTMRATAREATRAAATRAVRARPAAAALARLRLRPAVAMAPRPIVAWLGWQAATVRPWCQPLRPAPALASTAAASWAPPHLGWPQRLPTGPPRHPSQASEMGISRKITALLPSVAPG